jgi:anti-anti-sigma factor
VEYDEQKQGAVIVFKPNGALTGTDTDVFTTRFQATIGKAMGKCVLDASEVSYIDSAGLEALLDISDSLADLGRSLKISHVNDTLRETFDLTKTSAAFEYYDDINAAVRSYL